MSTGPVARRSQGCSFVLLAFLAAGAPFVAQQPAVSGGTPRPTSEANNAQALGSDTAPLAFEVATIKPAAPSPDGHTHINYPPGDRFSAINITLLAVMSWAYQLPQRQILDAPPWFSNTRFDLQAKIDADTTPAGTSSGQDQARKQRMVQSLLASRCNLKLHGETRVLPAYDLDIAKGGAKLQPSTANGKSVGLGSTHLNVQGLTLPLIAEQLSAISGRIVVDKTGLTGRYDFNLQWAPEDAPLTEGSAPSLFTAIQEQLGLKLESAKEPVSVLVIDGIDQPSAN